MEDHVASLAARTWRHGQYRFEIESVQASLRPPAVLTTRSEVIEIRDGAAQNIPELARVHVRADWDTDAPLFGTEAYMLNVADLERRTRQALRDGGELLVAVADDATVGFGFGHEDRIGALYLLATHHRQGIGRAILRKLVLVRTPCERGISDARFDAVAKNVRRSLLYCTGSTSVGRCVK
jgi:GNAT superfamily N-acetyltransferase